MEKQALRQDLPSPGTSAAISASALDVLEVAAAHVTEDGRLHWALQDRARALFGLALDPGTGLPDTVAGLDFVCEGAVSQAMTAERPVRHRIGRLLEFRFDPSTRTLVIRRLGVAATDRRATDASAQMVQSAIEEKRLVLLRQPIIDATDGAVVRRECLARLLDSDGSTVSPAVFIPVAERAGLIGMLDLATLDQALSWVAHAPGERLAVNVSAATVADEKARRAYLDRLALSMAEAPRMTVEITETIAIEDLDVASDFARAVHQLGARVALDDFGEGHTSFRSLLKIPLDEVKIDGLYVEGIDGRHEARAFVRAIAQLSGELGLETVAERVETTGEAAALQGLGIAIMQGYLFGRPSST